MKFLFVIFLILLNSSVLASNTDNWKLVKNIDKMTNKLESCYIMSKLIKADSELSFPYKNLQSSVVIPLYLKPAFTFTSNANLNEGSYTLKEKYGDVKMANREINTRIKFDENVQNVQLIQLLEHKVAIFFKNENDEKRLLKSNKVLLELDWYNEGKIYFEYDVKGVSQAIKNMKEKCKK